MKGVVIQDVNTPSMTFLEDESNHGRLTGIHWLSLIKLLELELSVRKTSEQMNLVSDTYERKG